ncbi:restriction endonuclease [Streptomyces sp. ME02-6987-2C]|uniref:restriction endonuclease n=1 Tax=unclassified Streptomyces TaxID=2593676 RepID=UPI0029B414F5|nr:MULTISPECIES: restriction endonuclease [unclassified Streptomyces]MDX3370464.1 restriction endonuclease [Streptomyces sp. ME02-6987-2C]MDX3425989.1 restriction endonuclease [Streptomyces sp. ME02-6985-2c]
MTLTGGQASASGPLLGDLLQVIVPRTIKPAELMASRRAEGCVRFLRPWNLASPFIVDPDHSGESDSDDGQWLTDAPPKNLVQEGDVLMQQPFGHRGPRLSIVGQISIPSAVGHSILILRPIDPIDPSHLRLITAFLRSSPQLRAHCAALNGHYRISASALRNLRVPSRDDALSAVLGELDSASAQMARWHQEAVSLTDNVFGDSEDPLQARRSIIRAGQLIRLRADAAAQLDDPGYIARTRFPYPLAQRWREVEARMSTDDRDRAYKAVLDAAEALLGFCALLVAGLAQEAGISSKALRSLKNKVSTQLGGPGFGDWTRILQQAASATGTDGLDTDHPFHELAALLIEGSDAGQAAARLAGRRNNHAHGRANEPLPSAAALAEAFADLALLFERARFLADWSLLHVTSVNWDRLSANETVSYRRLTGDHPVVPTATMVVTSADRTEAGSLYLADRDQNLHPLRPFLTCEICEACSSWSIFHADKENGQLIQRSLEHGHNYPYRGNEAALRAVGLR